ncbi:MAG TPA: DUF885 domain-containing protein, partial [Blastocatellia bacterium]|nr:DUF885 domain-containing protein [Blastocatellia bacterium]
MRRVNSVVSIFSIASLVLSGFIFLPSNANSQSQQRADSNAPDLGDLDSSRSELRGAIERYVADRGSLSRGYPVETSPARLERFKQFNSDWLTTIGKLNFDSLSLDGKVDYLLFKNQLEHELQQLEIQNKSLAEIAPLVPFAQTITDLAEARRRMEKLDPAKAAMTLNALNKQIEAARRSVEPGQRGESGKVKKSVANRAIISVNSLRGALRAWFGYYNGYDPIFTWWVDEPYKAVDQSLGNYATFLSERVMGL